jgi:hypothetical protein
MEACFMKKKKMNLLRKPIGAEVSIELWNELKVQAIREGRKTGQVLDDAIAIYLENKKSDILGWGFPIES